MGNQTDFGKQTKARYDGGGEGGDTAHGFRTQV